MIDVSSLTPGNVPSKTLGSISTSSNNGHLVTVDFYNSLEANKFQDAVERESDGEVTANKIGSTQVIVEVLNDSLIDTVKRVAKLYRGTVRSVKVNASTIRASDATGGQRSRVRYRFPDHKIATAFMRAVTTDPKIGPYTLTSFYDDRVIEVDYSKTFVNRSALDRYADRYGGDLHGSWPASTRVISASTDSMDAGELRQYLAELVATGGGTAVKSPKFREAARRLTTMVNGLTMPRVVTDAMRDAQHLRVSASTVSAAASGAQITDLKRFIKTIGPRTAGEFLTKVRKRWPGWTNVSDADIKSVYYAHARGDDEASASVVNDPGREASAVSAGPSRSDPTNMLRLAAISYLETKMGRGLGKVATSRDHKGNLTLTYSLHGARNSVRLGTSTDLAVAKAAIDKHVADRNGASTVRASDAKWRSYVIITRPRDPVVADKLAKIMLKAGWERDPKPDYSKPTIRYYVPESGRTEYTPVAAIKNLGLRIIAHDHGPVGASTVRANVIGTAGYALARLLGKALGVSGQGVAYEVVPTVKGVPQYDKAMLVQGHPGAMPKKASAIAASPYARHRAVGRLSVELSDPNRAVQAAQHLEELFGSAVDSTPRGAKLIVSYDGSQVDAAEIMRQVARFGGRRSVTASRSSIISAGPVGGYAYVIECLDDRDAKLVQRALEAASREPGLVDVSGRMVGVRSEAGIGRSKAVAIARRIDRNASVRTGVTSLSVISAAGDRGPVFDAENFKLAKAFADEYGRLHHEISQKYKALFAGIGAKMWPMDDMQSPKTYKPRDVSNDQDFGYWVWFTMNHPYVSRPLTVLDAYPEAKADDKRYAKFNGDVSALWDEHKKRARGIINKYKKLIKFKRIVGRGQKL